MYSTGMALTHIYHYAILKYGNLNMANISCKVSVIVIR